MLEHKKKDENDTSMLRLTEEFTTSSEQYVPPKFISELHTSGGGSLFDYYFSFDMSSWYRFSADKELNNTLVNYHHL